MSVSVSSRVSAFIPSERQPQKEDGKVGLTSKHGYGAAEV